MALIGSLLFIYFEQYHESLLAQPHANYPMNWEAHMHTINVMPTPRAKDWPSTSVFSLIIIHHKQ